MSFDLEVDVCCDGQAAWKSVQKQTPEFIITDIEMPKMTGLELLRNVRESENDKINRIPVVLATSLLDSEISEIAGAYGAATVLIKPLCKETICLVIDKLVRREAIDAIYDPNASLANAPGGISVSPTLRRLIRDTGR